MLNATLFLASALIWGSTWYVITFQLGVVPAEWSVAYRFALSAVAMLVFCLATGRRLAFSRIDHLAMAALGLFLFSSNYVLVYWGTHYLTSGLVAVTFSTMIVFNIFNGVVFLGQSVEPRVATSAAGGLVGLILIFWPEFEGFDLTGDTATGLAMCLVSSYMASLGNTVAASARIRALPVVQVNAWGMAYGALATAFFAWVTTGGPVLDGSFDYAWSLVYLALIGSIVAFSCYLALIKRIGIGRAGYVAIAIPIVALAISTAYEGYQWTPLAVAGLLLVIGGNAAVISRRTKPAPARRCEAAAE